MNVLFYLNWLNPIYVWVEPELYAVKRKEVLQHFYQTQPLYQTEYFQQNFEQSAKNNLKNIIE